MLVQRVASRLGGSTLVKGGCVLSSTRLCSSIVEVSGSGFVLIAEKGSLC